MARFLVTYDLVKGKDYQALWDEMERLGAHKALLSVYLLDLTDDDPTEVRNHFDKFVDDDDRLFVAKLSDASAQRCFKGTNDWIATRFG